jgi:hypothetical protein
MAEELKYRIAFTKGSLEGKLFPLGGEAVTIGRSHTCGIRVMEPDVSGRHVMLTLGAKGVELEVISSRRTVLDGRSLKTGDVVGVRAGQSVSMGGTVEFTLECYRSEGERTIGPDSLADGMTRFGDDATAHPGAASVACGGDSATQRPGAEETSMTRPAVGVVGGDDDTGTHIPPPGGGRRAVPPPRRPVPPPPRPAGAAHQRRRGSDDTSTGTVGTQAFPVPPPPEATVGTEVLQPAADATQIIQTRAATPQEMAYMRELHNKKRRKKLGVRLGLGGVVAAVAGGLCVWLAMHAPEQRLTIPKERKMWKLVDQELRPVAGEAAGGVSASLFLSYPAEGGFAQEGRSKGTNGGLGVEETVFTVKTRVGRDLDVPLQLKVVAYTIAASLGQSQEESFADWDRTNGLGLEKQAKLAKDFMGEDPGIPCLRYTYTRKATPAEEAEGVLDWAGVLSFFRLRDTCFVYFREVPSVEELRAEHMLLRTGVFLGLNAPMVRERWAGLNPSRQYGGELAILRNSAKELMDKNMDNEWEELEDKLTTILIRTFPRRKVDADTGRLYGETLEWMKILRARQTETWKRRCIVRFRATRDKHADVKRMDDEIRALFRSPDDRRHVKAQKDKWWEQ